MTAEKTASLVGFAVKCEHCGGGTLAPDGASLRCLCGSLLARYVEGGLELKCRRCKRTVTVPLQVTDAPGG